MSTTQSSLSTLTDRQHEILILIYRFRFLNRLQIQTLLNHKQFNRIIIWLNELTENNYLIRYYSKSQATIPAIYSLGPAGRKYLRKYPTEQVKTELLDRVWREKTTSAQFKSHCQLVADIYLSLITLSKLTKTKLSFFSKTDLHGMKYLIQPSPDAYFSLEETDGYIKRYFLEIIDDYASTDKLVQLILRYFTYYSKQYWQNHTDKPFPEIIFICPDLRAKKCLYAVIRRKLKKEPNIRIYLALREDMKEKGICREVLDLVK